MAPTAAASSRPPTQQIEFVTAGPVAGTPYGKSGMASGRQMPGFGVQPERRGRAAKTATMSADQVMLTEEQIAAVVDYERSL